MECLGSLRIPEMMDSCTILGIVIIIKDLGTIKICVVLDIFALLKNMLITLAIMLHIYHDTIVYVSHYM